MVCLVWLLLGFREDEKFEGWSLGVGAELYDYFDYIWHIMMWSQGLVEMRFDLEVLHPKEVFPAGVWTYKELSGLLSYCPQNSNSPCMILYHLFI